MVQSKAEKEKEAKKKAKAEAKKNQEEEEAAAAAKPKDLFAPAPLVPNANHAHFFEEVGSWAEGSRFGRPVRHPLIVPFGRPWLIPGRPSHTDLVCPHLLLAYVCGVARAPAPTLTSRPRWWGCERCAKPPRRARWTGQPWRW